MSVSDLSIAKYVRSHVQSKIQSKQREVKPQTTGRLEKAFSLLPDDILDLFLSENRVLTIVIEPNLQIPLGMATKTLRKPSGLNYFIIIRQEQEDWPEDLFLGAFFRELGHVVRERLPEDEWPVPRGDRARFRERIEYEADAMVWKWGLRHYSMRHLFATYPEQWAEKIVSEIEKILSEDRRLH
ncbi:hypothetical protein [Desulfomonile tiedjei]|uniref:Uncharacterized protein n=1 Tax=Desulfomonile tiedjei (strain ATCC 49306 / DSM 6799 / DCB-1) TaxID=706587 RepID=I4C8B1_DESTA|nr:hypothetical protein [Desulfomonile tiedjei]AFM25802.1 hypothetical protein Desti_3140 [Desulfomonile tiedjei DSM 6799]